MASSEIEHVGVRVDGLDMHAAIAGPDDGPAVVLCHGFPQGWYAWRHQLLALGAAGYRAVAPDLRGYGLTGAPDAVDEYTTFHIVGDLIGLLGELDIDRAVFIGHDVSAPVVWQAALMRPDRVRAVGAIGMPYAPRLGARPTDTLRATMRDGFFYLLYFQDVGIAEGEMDQDVRGTLRRLFHSLSADLPADESRFFDPHAHRFNDLLREPDAAPAWLTEADLDYYTAEIERRGTFRHALNWYRNVDRNWELTAGYTGMKIPQPALFIGGEADRSTGLTPARVAAANAWIPQLRPPVWIPNCGHWAAEEAPDAVNAALVEFLGSL